MKHSLAHKVSACLFAAAALGAFDARADQIECTSVADKVKAITETKPFYITTEFQFDTPPLQPLLKTKVFLEKPGCLVAHLSALARITDNYVFFQVRVDGVPLAGHQYTGLANPDTPVARVSLDEGTAPYDDEQFSDPTKAVAYNFFGSLREGGHVVEVLAAGGSGIDPSNPPQVDNLVLTLEHP